MIPNLIWFLVPAPNDILRNESKTPGLDLVSIIFQVIMVVSLILIKNKNQNKLAFSRYLIFGLVFLILYYVSWTCYYVNIVSHQIILGLTISPCLVFIICCLERKNYLAMFPTIIFSICHIVYALINFIII